MKVILTEKQMAEFSRRIAEMYPWACQDRTQIYEAEAVTTYKVNIKKGSDPRIAELLNELNA